MPPLDTEGLADPADKLVLVVEDDKDTCDLYCHVAVREGFRVEAARDGAAALRLAASLKPNLILLDLMLPLQGGFEALKALQVPETRRIPVVVVTARQFDDTTRDMISAESNVVEFLRKPVALPALVLALHHLLGTRPPARAES